MSILSLKIGGLHCSSCAEKLQEQVAKINNVHEVHVDIVTNKIKITYENMRENELVNQIREAISPLGANIEGTPRPGIFALDSGLKFRLLRYTVAMVLYSLAQWIVADGHMGMWLFLASYAILGYDVLYKSLIGLLNKDIFNENFLMTVACFSAIIIGMYHEAVLVMAFFQVGEFFQDMAVNRSRKSIADLMNIKAEYANVLIDGEMQQADPSKVAIGSTIIIKPGEKVPLDGTITNGTSQLDVGSLMGESVPRTVGIGEEILSGSINLTAVLTVKVTKDYTNSTVSKILDMVESASAKKSQTERFITRFARIYTPFVVGAALLLMFVPTVFFPYANSAEWIYRGIVFLLISCPCALHLSVPLSFFSGVGRASKKGVLVKGSTFLQVLSQVNIVVFDKTGTLTKGVFKVTDISPKGNADINEILQLATSLESYSTHPIAKSIVQECEARSLVPYYSLENVQEIPGQGLKGTVDGRVTLVGNIKLLEAYGVESAEYNGAGTIVHVARAGGADNIEYLGYIEISDIIKPDTAQGIKKLKSLGVEHTVMLSGDRTAAAQYVAEQVGIDSVYPELLPNQKVEYLEQLYEKYPGKKIAFVGDGINDAPVLTRSDVGIAMGGIGSDAAVEAADVVLMTDQIPLLADAIAISKRTMKRVMQNIVFVLTIKFTILGLTVLGFGNIFLAILADTGLTVLAVVNSTR